MELNLKDIKAIAMDVDGVLTNGTIIHLENGDQLRAFDAKDTFSVRVAGLKGLVVGIMSGGKCPSLYQRCLNLGIKPENIHLGCRGKLEVFHQFCKDNGLKPSEVLYMGDDIPDTQVLRAAGIGVVPNDAADEAKAAADMVSDYPGGHWCVRKTIEMVMKAQSLWEFDENRFDLIF